ncbi:hypothetical protein [Streptomyces sp. NPDC013181]|uniref:hypothetical protein n=1 Tax=Streptomyces sp. NPDC013181 TaxID=3364864 RepID=UPI00367F4AAA
MAPTSRGTGEPAPQDRAPEHHGAPAPDPGRPTHDRDQPLRLSGVADRPRTPGHHPPLRGAPGAVVPGDAAGPSPRPAARRRCRTPPVRPDARRRDAVRAPTTLVRSLLEAR